MGGSFCAFLLPPTTRTLKPPPDRYCMVRRAGKYPATHRDTAESTPIAAMNVKVSRGASPNNISCSTPNGC